jgi:putative ABC transport system permease protein
VSLSVIGMRTEPAVRADPPAIGPADDQLRPASAPPRTPVRPRRAGGVLLLPPWTRAPMLGFRAPAVILAVLGAAAILACASSSGALFLSSAGAEALHRMTAADCPDATYPTIQHRTSGPYGPGADTLGPVAMTQAGLAPPYEVLTPESTITIGGRSNKISGPDATRQVNVFYRADVTAHVTVLSRGPASGVWLPDTLAGYLGLRAGDPVTIGRWIPPVPVAGVYRDLTRGTLRPDWCAYAPLLFDVGSPVPPRPLVLASDLEVVNTLQRAQPYEMTEHWVSPVDPTRLTLSSARDLNARQAKAYERFGSSPREDLRSQLSGTGQLPVFAAQATLIRAGLRGPVVPIALGGTLLALLLIGAAGSYWADRRLSEVRLLSSRGVGPAGLAVKALLELAGPAVVGTLLGWLAARWLVQALGPSRYLDAAAPWQALATAGLALVAGLALLALVAGLRSRAATERPVGARRSRLAAVPWELAVLAAAGGCYLVLRHGQAVTLSHRVAQVSLLVVTFPLLFVAGGALLAVRALVPVLAAITRRLGRRWPAWYLAGRRLTAGRLVSVILLAAATVPVAVSVYAAGLTGTAQHTLDAKARLFVGADVSVQTVDPVTRTPATDRAGTLVTRYEYAELDGQRATVLAVDPDTFAGSAYWDRRYADQPLTALLAALRQPVAAGQVPALYAARDAGTPPAIGQQVTVNLGTTAARLAVIGVPRLFPGRQLPIPLLIVDRARLGPVDAHAGTINELWSRGDAQAAQAALVAQHARIYDVTTVATVFDAANFLGISWTFGYLSALAALVGLVAVGGLLLYLETRQRTRVTAYALGRRMGLTRATHLRSLLAELGTLLLTAYLLGIALATAAVLLVYHWLDVDLSRPPTPLLTVPVVAIVTAGLAVAVIAALAATYAQRAADRTNVAEVLRLGS